MPTLSANQPSGEHEPPVEFVMPGDQPAEPADPASDVTASDNAVVAEGLADPTVIPPTPPYEQPPTPPYRPVGTATDAAAPPAAPASAPSGPSWVIVALVASLIGGLLGAGIVAALDRDERTAAGRPANNSVNRNTSAIAQPQDIQGILAKVQPGVVAIKTQAFQRGIFGNAIPQAGAGTGMVISADGDVLTNAHVVRGATTIEVTLYGENTARQADLVGSDPSADVAVIKIRDARDLPTVQLGSSAELQVGDSVLAIGNALALPGGPSVTLGIVSAKDRTIGADDEQLEGLIQTDAAINQGNSGGPLVNADGEVVGMNTAVIQSSGQALVQNVGFAIAIDTIKPMIERLRRGQGGVVASQAFIGVSAQTLTEEIKEQYGLTADKGAIVVEVTPGSPAENAGIDTGDIITKFGDQTIESSEQLVAAVRARKPGDRVEITYVRGRDQRKATIVVGSRRAS